MSKTKQKPEISIQKTLAQTKYMRSKIVNSYMKKFGVGIADLDDLKNDLEQAAAMGVVEAYNKFEPGKGSKLTTFCYYFIQGNVQTQVALLFPSMRLPTTKISSDYYAYDLSDIVIEQAHVLSTYDNTIEDLEVGGENLNALAFHLTPAQVDALFLKFGVREQSFFPKLEPMRPILENTAMIKLQRLISEGKLDKETFNL